MSIGAPGSPHDVRSTCGTGVDIDVPGFIREIAADRAVQVFGGRGWSELCRPMRHLQDVRVFRIYEGTDEIMKLKIASRLLRKDFEAYR